MKDFRQRAFVGLIGLVSAGLLSVGCSSSNNTTGSGGSNGSGGSHTGGSTGTGTGGNSTATGGAGGGAVAAGCATSDPAASALIADFSGDAGVEATGGGLFIYPGTIGAPGPGGPTVAVTGGALHVTDTVAPTTAAQYVGVGIYFSGNAGGTDCTDAHTYTGVQFDIKGSLTGGCTLQYSTNDSEHAAVSTSDPKAGGATGSYAPQAQIASNVTSAGSTVKVAFTDSALGTGSPATPIDPTKLEGVQWQLTVPAATAVGDAGSTSCVLDMTIDNVKFY
jgi:hypothetical protein